MSKWTDFPLPAEDPQIERGQLKRCFENAATYAARHGFSYVEGLACGPLRDVHHAWVVNDAGEVLDPTWGYSPKHAYRGIIFGLAEVLALQERAENGDPIAMLELFRDTDGAEEIRVRES